LPAAAVHAWQQLLLLLPLTHALTSSALATRLGKPLLLLLLPLVLAEEPLCVAFLAELWCVGGEVGRAASA